MIQVYKKIKNPLTGKQININTKLGKKILFNYLTLFGGVSGGSNILPKLFKNKLLESKTKREEKTTELRKSNITNCFDKVSNVTNIFNSEHYLNRIIENLTSNGTDLYTELNGERYFHNGKINKSETKKGAFSYVKELIFEKNNSDTDTLPLSSEDTLPLSSEDTLPLSSEKPSSYKAKQESKESTASFEQTVSLKQPISDELIKNDVNHYKFTGVLSSNPVEIELNDKIDRISILEKVSIDKEKFLDEVILHNKLIDINNICPNIIPIKNINGRIFMLKGDGTLRDMTNIDIDIADKIIKCLEETLKCLIVNGFYYFDLKSYNVVYTCINNNLLIWLIDLGSVLGMKLIGSEELGKIYISTSPHPIINNKLFNYKKSIPSNCITEDLTRYWDSIYAYQLSSLFFQLIGINAFIRYNKIDECSTAEILTEFLRIQNDIDMRFKKDIEKDKIKRYYSVYTDIIGDLKTENIQLNTCKKHENFYNKG